MAYPATLKCPQVLDYEPVDRRLTSDAERPREARALSRDEHYFAQARFPAFTPEQVAIFRAWWTTDLVYGGAWFAATWPSPRGAVVGVFRFAEAPRYDFVPGGMWKISARVEVRGRGLVPAGDSSDAIFLDTFTGAASTLLGAHAPDIAPAGFVYLDNASGPDTDLQLDGSGRAITVPTGFATSGTANSDASDPAFLLELELPYTLTLTARPSSTMNSSLVSVTLLNTSDNSLLRITFERSSGGQYREMVELENNALGGGFLFEATSFDGVAEEHTVSVLVEATQATVTFDGVAGTPVDLGGDAVTVFNRLAYILDRDDPTDDAYLNRVEIS